MQWEIISGFGKLETVDIPNTNITPWGNTSVRALFSKETIKVKVHQKGNGNVNVKGEAIAVPGKPLSLVATPKPGWIFSKWEIISGKPVIANITSSNTSITLNEPCTILAVFIEEAERYGLRYNSKSDFYKDDVTMILKAKKGGDVESSAGTELIPPNTDVTISASAHEGFRFKYWKVSGRGGSVVNSKEQTTQAKVSKRGDATFTAVFEKLPNYQIAEFENPESDK